MLEISYFNSATENTPAKTLTIRQVLESIKNGEYKDKIEKLRAVRAKSESDYKKQKKYIPAVTFSANFHGERSICTPFEHTGIVLADIDGLNGKKDEIKSKITSDNKTAFLFESPSNDGIKVGFRFIGEISDDEAHKRCWKKVEQYIREQFQIDIDPSGKDVSRLCFVSYDPDLYSNPKCDTFEIPAEENTNPPQTGFQPEPYSSIFKNEKDATYAQSVADMAMETAYREIVESQPGSMHYTRLRMSRLVGGYVGGGLIDYEIAYAKLADAVKWSGSKDHKSALKTVSDGLKYGMAVPITKDQIDREREGFQLERYLESVDRIATKDEPTQDQTNVTDVTEVTDVTLSEEIDKIKENIVFLLYKRYARARARIKGCDEIPDSLSPEDIIKEVLHTDFAKSLEIKEKNELIRLCYSCYALIHPCYTSVTPLLHPDTGEEKAKAKTEIKQQKQLDIKGKILEWVQESFGWFTCREVYEAFGAKTPNEKSVLRIVLSRLSKESVIEKHRTQNGTYRKIDNVCQDIDFMSACDDFTDIWLPFHLNTMARILPGNIIVLAGSPNAGKTALLLNIIRYNLVKNWTIHYFNSEMGADEMRLRLKLFKDMTLEDWGRYRDRGLFNPKTRSHDFQDVIIPGDGNINVIDYLEMHDNFWEVGGILRDIHDRLDGAIAFIALQKPRGRDTAKGGDITLEKPRLYLSVEGGIAKIIKMKSFQGTENPNGKQIKFRLVEGSEIIIDSHWHYPK